MKYTLPYMTIAKCFDASCKVVSLYFINKTAAIGRFLTLYYMNKPRFLYVEPGPLSMATQENLRHLKLEGALGLMRGPSLQAELLEALDSASEVYLDVSDATEIDLSFLQILIAAHKTAKLEKKTLAVTAAGSESLAREIARCGLPASVLPDFRDVFPS